MAWVAFVIAKDSESHRQISTTALYQMRISLEEFRDMMMLKMMGRFKEQIRWDTLADGVRRSPQEGGGIY